MVQAFEGFRDRGLPAGIPCTQHTHSMYTQNTHSPKPNLENLNEEASDSGSDLGVYEKKGALA